MHQPVVPVHVRTDLWLLLLFEDLVPPPIASRAKLIDLKLLVAIN